MSDKTFKRLSRRETGIAAAAVMLGLLLGALLFRGGGGPVHDNADFETETVTEYTCSMHPQIRQQEPGLCPICAMDLVPVDGGSTDAVDDGEIAMSASAVKLADVRTEAVQMGRPEKILHLTGEVRPDERGVARITTRFPGRIETLWVNETGQRVQRGERLASVYSPELISAQRALLEAMPLRTSHPALYRSARSRLRLWGFTDSEIDALESRGEVSEAAVVSAPLSGTVLVRHAARGDYVKEGAVLFEIADLSRVWVEFDAYESDLPWIGPGDEVAFSMQALPGKTFLGQVAFIDPVINKKTRTARIRVEADNPGRGLRPGSFAQGRIRSSLDESLTIPKSAVLWTGKRAVVYVKEPGRDEPVFSHREIVLGPDTGNRYVVASGLEPGEEVAVNGVFRIDASAQLAGKRSMMTPGPPIRTDTAHDGHGVTRQETSVSHAMFHVGGACGMCKSRIEKTASGLEGVKSAVWDQESQTLHLNYDNSAVALSDVHKALAAAGHDTDVEKAPDEVYEKLPACCHYEREK